MFAITLTCLREKILRQLDDKSKETNPELFPTNFQVFDINIQTTSDICI